MTKHHTASTRVQVWPTMLALFVCLSVVATAPMSQAAAQTVAGVIDTLKGSATATQGGTKRALAKGGEVYQGDSISVAGRGALRVRFKDDTTLDVGENSTVTIDEFVYDPNAAASGKLTAGIAKGTFRFVSGKIAAAKPENVSINTPVATIGVRGTRFAGQTDGGSAEVVLLAEVPKDKKTAILVANAAGSVIIAQSGFGTTVAGPNVAPTPPQRWRQNRINAVTRSITRSLPRLRIPTTPRAPKTPR